MEEGWGVGAAAAGGAVGRALNGRHIKKRALRNKALSIGFDDKSLRDFVTGFHKRKKKRRKQAQRQIQEKQRLKRIHARKQRKLERELSLNGGDLQAEGLPTSGLGPEENGSGLEDDECNRTSSVAGTKIYDSNDMTITVTTSEISREDEDHRRPAQLIIPEGIIEGDVRKQSLHHPENKGLKRGFTAAAKQRSLNKKNTLQKNGSRNKKP